MIPKTIVIRVTALGITNILISMSFSSKSKKEGSYSIYSPLFDCINNSTYLESGIKLKILFLLSSQFLIISTVVCSSTSSTSSILSFNQARSLSYPFIQVLNPRFSTILLRYSIVATITTNVI